MCYMLCFLFLKFEISLIEDYICKGRLFFRNAKYLLCGICVPRMWYFAPWGVYI